MLWHCHNLPCFVFSCLKGYIFFLDVAQDYEVQVYSETVLVDNVAVLHCIIPESVKDYVIVTEWYRDDTTIQQEHYKAGKWVQMNLRNWRLWNTYLLCTLLSPRSVRRSQTRSLTAGCHKPINRLGPGGSEEKQHGCAKCATDGSKFVSKSEVWIDEKLYRKAFA
jgi:hypothetical protein